MEDPWAAGPSSWSSTSSTPTCPITNHPPSTTSPTKTTADLSFSLPSHATGHSSLTENVVSADGGCGGPTGVQGVGEYDADPWATKTPTALASISSPRPPIQSPLLPTLSLDNQPKGFEGWGEDVNAGWGAPASSSTSMTTITATQSTTMSHPSTTNAADSLGISRDSLGISSDRHYNESQSKSDLPRPSILLPKETSADDSTRIELEGDDVWGIPDRPPTTVPLPNSPSPPESQTPTSTHAITLPPNVSLSSPTFSSSSHLSRGSPSSAPPAIAARVLDEAFDVGGRGQGGVGLGMGMPKSPSFGSEFGGFATVVEGDPWSGDAWGDGTVGGTGRRDSGFSFSDKKPDKNEEEGEGWGGVGAMTSPNTKQQDDDWESAQRKMKIRQDRVPYERVESIRQGWKEAAGAIIGLDKIVERSEDEERTLEKAVRDLQLNTTDTLNALSTLPPDTNIYPPVLTSLSTYQRYQAALSRANPNPSTSLLTIPYTASMRRRTDDSLVFDVPDYSWAGRSRLGEPDALNQEASSVAEDAGRSRWAFWNRRATSTPKPLLTSGGGVLEVKSVIPTSEPNSASYIMGGTASGAAGISASPLEPAISSTSMSQNSSITSGIFGRSRPATPEPSATPPASTTSAEGAAVAGAAQETHEDFRHMTSGGSLDHHNQPVSAVSRFFGRFSSGSSGSSGGMTGKRSQSSRNIGNFDATDHDLELTTDDLSYLAEVPSIPNTMNPQSQGVADLLQLDPSHSPAASLESVLSNRGNQSASPSTKIIGQAIFPSPAQPSYPSSIGRPTGPTGGRSSLASSQQTSSNSFVPRMTTTFDTKTQRTTIPASTTTNFDLLSGLDFNDFSPSTAAINHSPVSNLVSSPILTNPSNTTSTLTTSSSSTWDDLLNPKPPITVTPIMQSRPTLASPINSSLSAPPRARSGGSSSTIEATKLGNDNDDIDDFGDFSAFETPKPLQPSSSGFGSVMSTTGTTIQSRPHLDHTPTISLMSGASASRGRRWPAPPSPVPPPLEPPPRGPSFGLTDGSSAFPFLSPPPPPGRPSSRSGFSMNLLDEGMTGGNDSTITSSSGVVLQNGISPTPPPPPPLRPPPQSAPMSAPLSPAKQESGSGSSSLTIMPNDVGTSPKPTTSAQTNQQGGLSAQDISFFDSLLK